MKSIINTKILLKGELLKDHVVLYDERIEQIITSKEYEGFAKKTEIKEEVDGQGHILSPGFIDVHIHGYKGIDVMDGTVDTLNQLSQSISENGVTAYLATTMTMDNKSIKTALTSVKEAMNHRENGFRGAMVLGAHLEGPFINETYKGAQPKEFIRLPNEQLIEDFKDVIKVITIAPEVEGAMSFIKKYSESISFSIGHSGATYEQAKEAFESGAASTTHLFNAMTGLHHRKPGIVGAAFDCDCYSEIIADNFHIHPGLYSLIKKVKGVERLLLITDCMRAGGLDEGEYELGGQKVFMKNNQCTLESGTIAGSVLKLNEGLRNFSVGAKGSVIEHIPMVTLNQAKYLKMDKDMGSIDIGKLANFVLINENVNILKTIVKGKIVYENQL